MDESVTIAWSPSEKQEHALVRTEFEILYGGARGGGKTDAGMAWLLYDIHNPRYRGLVIRRNADDLRDWIDRARIMYAGTGAVFSGQPTEIRFPSGAVIRTGHLKDDDAYTKYQGHEYHKMLIEELTQIPTERRYLMLISSCRSTVPDLRPQVFATTNPGGAGHDWVKKRFIDPVEWGMPYTDKITGRQRVFIPAKAEDNPHLMANDPSYVQFLEGLPPNLRKAWRYGEWENYEVDGAYYATAMKFLFDNNRITSIPYDGGLLVSTWWDLGMNDLTTIWFTQQVGNEIRVIDFFQHNGEGLAYYAELIRAKGYHYEKHTMPHDVMVKELGTGKSRFEVAEALGIKPLFVAQKLSLEDGIESTRNLLYKCYFDRELCAEGLAALKAYRREFDEKGQVYRNYPVHDQYSHAADAFRTMAVSVKDNAIEYPDPNASWEAHHNDSW